MLRRWTKAVEENEQRLKPKQLLRESLTQPVMSLQPRSAVQ